MSDSPKYSLARLRDEQERRLREERERQAALERARREAEEERRRRERLEQDRKAARHHLSDVQQALVDFSNAETARFIPSERLEALHIRLHQAENVICNAKQEDRLRSGGTEIRSIRDELQLLAADAETAKLCADLAVEEATVVRLEQQLAAMDHARSEKFDRAGFQEVGNLLKVARSHLQQQALEYVRRETTVAHRRLEKHRADVAERFARWRAAKDRAEAAIATASDRIAGLLADDVVIRWVRDMPAVLKKRLASVAGLIQAEQFEQVCAESAVLIKGTEDIVAEAQDLQLKEDRRQYIVNGILEVMQEMGFVVQQGSPALEHPGVLTSATTIQAIRIGGGALAVSVPQDGEIWYDVAGFPMRVETTADGKAIRTCDEAEQEIDRMHQAMKDAFGIEMSELLWDTKDPNRIRKAAERRPESAPAFRTRGK